MTSQPLLVKIFGRIPIFSYFSILFNVLKYFFFLFSTQTKSWKSKKKHFFWTLYVVYFILLLNTFLLVGIFIFINIYILYIICSLYTDIFSPFFILCEITFLSSYLSISFWPPILYSIHHFIYTRIYPPYIFVSFFSLYSYNTQSNITETK